MPDGQYPPGNSLPACPSALLPRSRSEGVRPARRARAVTLFVGALLLVFGLAPYGFGLRAQAIYTTLVDHLAQLWLVPLATTRYQRGWFSSTAEMFLALSPDVRDAWRPYLPSPGDSREAPAGISVRQQILHGPFPFAWRSDGSGLLRPVQALLTTTLRPGSLRTGPIAAPPVPTVHVDTTIFLSGASQSRFFFPAFTVPPGTAAAPGLVWDGLRGEVSLTQQGQHLLGAMRAPGLQLQRDAMRVRLHNALGRVEVVHKRRRPLHGQVAVSVDAVEVAQEPAGQADWAIHDGELRTSMVIADGTMQAEVDLQCGTCRLATVAYNQGAAHLEVDRLSLPALLHLGREVMVLWPDEPSMATLWLRVLFSGELASFLADVAKTSPTFTLSQARLHTPEGIIHLTAHMHLDGARVLFPRYLPQLLSTIEAHATVEAPVSWVQAMALTLAVHSIRAQSAFGAFLPTNVLRTLATRVVDTYLHRLVEQAYLIQDGTTYKSTARYTNGQLWVNEKPVEPGLFGLH